MDDMILVDKAVLVGLKLSLFAHKMYGIVIFDDVSENIVLILNCVDLVATARILDVVIDFPF